MAIILRAASQQVSLDLERTFRLLKCCTNLRQLVKPRSVERRETQVDQRSMTLMTAGPMITTNRGGKKNTIIGTVS